MIEFDERLLLELEAQRHSASASAKRQRYLDLLGPQPGERILDLGCGSGSTSRALVPLVQPGGRVVGVDSSRQAREVANRLSTGIEPGALSFEHADGHSLPFGAATFEAAICISVLEFCHDPARVLEELRRVLRPGGRFLVANSDEDTRVYYGHDRELGRRITRAIADRGHDPWLARRLAYLLRSSGFAVLDETLLADVEHEFAPGSSGYALAHAWRDYLLGSGGISEHDYRRWLADLESCAREGSYFYSVTTYVYLAEGQDA